MTPHPRTPLRSPAFAEWRLDDGYLLRGRVWASAAPKPPVALLYFHGIQSHGGWYEWSASLLAASGIPVVMPDRRGSGTNHDDRGDVATRRRWDADVDALAAWVQHEFGVTRLAVLGVSWGGKLAASLTLRQPHLVSHAALITPGIYPAVDVGLSGRFAIAASLMAGGDRFHAIPLSDPTLFTDNPAGVAFIRDDELKLTHATARFLFESARYDGELRRARPAQNSPRILLVLASDDRIIRNDVTERWAARVFGPAASTVVLSPAAHTLEFCADAGPYCMLLERWRETVIAGRES